jgi:hypothetical protein
VAQFLSRALIDAQLRVNSRKIGLVVLTFMKAY